MIKSLFSLALIGGVAFGPNAAAATTPDLATAGSAISFQARAAAAFGNSAGDIIDVPDESEFAGTVTLPQAEVETLSDSERGALVGKKIELAGNNAEYATIEELPEQTGTTQAPSATLAKTGAIHELSCPAGGDHQWFRMVESSGRNHCFASAGDMHVSYTIKGRCPGANKGQIKWGYTNAGSWSEGNTKWDSKVGPLPSSKYSTCYWYTSPKVVRSYRLHIF